MKRLDNLFLVDQNPQLVKAWKESFEEFPEVHPSQEDFFSVSADAMVSPANSFGIMDGGLDLLIRKELGRAVEDVLQGQIRQTYHGELPVGSAEIISTGHARWPFLISAPTMRIPEDVSGTINSYLTFRAVLLSVQKYNATAKSNPIRSIVCPGLGTGVGKMPPRTCAAQMRMAYVQMLGDGTIPPYERIHQLHHQLKRVF
jgi:O-acetyl-ADP-ribose deacetylase (regulator of RNase III)